MARSAPRHRQRTTGFEAVFDAHHAEALRLAWLLVGDHHQAEDVVADAMAKVWLQWRKGRIDNVHAYLRRAVANTANSRLRRRYLERRVANRRTGDDRGALGSDEHTVEHDAMWTAIQALPRRQRQVVVLRYYEDLSAAETAELLDVTVGTVGSNLSRALDKLQADLHPHDTTAKDPAENGGGR